MRDKYILSDSFDFWCEFIYKSIFQVIQSLVLIWRVRLVWWATVITNWMYRIKWWKSIAIIWMRTAGQLSFWLWNRENLRISPRSTRKSKWMFSIYFFLTSILLTKQIQINRAEQVHDWTATWHQLFILHQRNSLQSRNNSILES